MIVSCSSGPISPAATRVWMSENDGSKRRLKPSMTRSVSGPIAARRPVDLRDVEVDRLLAEHRLAGADAAGEQVDMRRCRRRDHHAVDGRIVEHGGGVRAPRGAELLADLPGRRLERVDDVSQLGPRMDGHRAGMHAPDPAAADHAESHHVWLPTIT
jgi:hypothetical protein